MKRTHRKRLNAVAGKETAAKIAKLPSRARKEAAAIAELFPRTGVPLSKEEMKQYTKTPGVNRNGRVRVKVGTKGRKQRFTK